MRIRIFFILIFALSIHPILLLKGQENVTATQGASTRIGNDRATSVLVDQKDSKAAIFYSAAEMYVAPNTEADKTTMLVLGTTKYADTAKIVQKGITEMTGDFVLVKDPAIPYDSKFKYLFADDVNNPGLGTVKFIGKWNKQSIARETLDGLRAIDDYDTKVNRIANFPYLKVVKEGIVPVLEGGKAVLKKPELQTTEVLAGHAIPEYDYDNMGVVVADPSIAMSVEKLDFTEGNRFSIDVESEGIYKNESVSSTLDNTDGAKAARFYALNSAYVDIKELVTVASSQDVQFEGHSEVNMKLYKYSATDPSDPSQITDNAQEDVLVKNTNTFQVTNVQINGGWDAGTFAASFLRGITSPFDTGLRADYMFYHVLAEPNSWSITSFRDPIASPKTNLQSGKGYFYAMDVSREWFDNIQDNWHDEINPIHPTPWMLRERGGYNFSRILRQLKYDTDLYKGGKFKAGQFNLYSAVVGDPTNPRAESDFGEGASKLPYEPQRFNTGKIEIDIYGEGSGVYNYLANPYMTPIQINSLLGTGVTNLGALFDVGNGTGVNAIHDLSQLPADADKNKAILRTRYWVVNSGLVGTVTDPSDGLNYYAYNVKYDVVDAVTTAGTIVNPDKKKIEPLQMFIVQAAQSGKFTFSDELKTTDPELTRFKVTDLLSDRSDQRPTKNTEENSREENIIPDWLLMEAAVLSNNGTISELTADRTAVRFFDTATEGIDSDHDVKKTLVPEKKPTKAQVKSVSDTYEEVFSPTNVLYTTTPRGDALLGNSVNYGIKEVPLHYLPGAETQDVLLAFHGIDGFDRVEGVWLIDHFENDRKVKLHDGYEYQFASQPNESYVGSENRFTLLFGESDDIVIAENPITCYYSGSTLHIGGLNEGDLGSKVFIYDLQGRLMGNTTINNYPGMEYNKPLGQGTFIVKIVGNRNFNTKFVNLRNY